MVIMFFMREGLIIRFLREVQGRKVSMSAELVNFMGRGGVQGPVMVDNRLIFIIIIRIRLWCVRGRQSQGKLRSWYDWGEGWRYDWGGDV